MRADRLLSIVLLLQHRGRMAAAALARELEVSTRTVLRDVEALSAAGIPVYAERGRRGGFALLPGFSTDLTGLTAEEALALLVAGSRVAPESLGMAPALASAMRKVVAALPREQRGTASRAAERILARPESWLSRPERPKGTEAAAVPVLAVVQHAVFAGRRLRIRYATPGQRPTWRTVDPVGLVSAAGHWYLLATHRGADRTYRVSRIRTAEELAEEADRADAVDLEQIWQQRRETFHASMTAVRATVRVRARRRPELARSALTVEDERADRGGWLRLRLIFADRRHAEAVLWTLGADAEALDPSELRAALHERAIATAARYGTT